ncbi:hypothetical protein [Streptomyces odonnellii]|uniref:hypothetical protein n=1 Tax=Streptomyces odonnellii TaxID=1417980 RepID=UPI0006267EA0|nr:hypothetical protein [Streptomyces odonnellii]
MSDTTGPKHGQGIPDSVIPLLAAIADALNLPLPSVHQHDERAYHRLLERRSQAVRSQLLAILAYPDLGFVDDAARIRSETAASPVTYTPWKDPRDGEAASC